MGDRAFPIMHRVRLEVESVDREEAPVQDQDASMGVEAPERVPAPLDGPEGTPPMSAPPRTVPTVRGHPIGPRPPSAPHERLRAALPVLALLACACGGSDPADPIDPPEPEVAWVEMLPSERPLSFLGGSFRMGARRVAADGTFLGGSFAYPDRFTWASDAASVVTVDQRGVVTALSEGTARITATSDGAVGTALVTVREAVRLAWSFPLVGPPGGLTVAEDGTIYVADRESLHALTPEGEKLWSVPTGARANSSPALAGDRSLFVGTAGNGPPALAVDPAGVVRWTREDIGWVSTSPAIDADGTIYMVAGDSTLHALDPDGQTRWAFRIQDQLRTSPGVTADGTVLVGGDDGRLYAVGPDGQERWTFQTGGRVQSSPVIAADGTIHLASNDRHLYALSPAGEERWRVELEDPAPAHVEVQRGSSPAIGTDGTLYIGGRGLTAIAPDGSVRWVYPGIIPGGVEGLATPVVAGDGTVYVGSTSALYAVTPEGLLKWDYPARGAFFRVPAIGLDGTILVAKRLPGFVRSRPSSTAAIARRLPT